MVPVINNLIGSGYFATKRHAILPPGPKIALTPTITEAKYYFANSSKITTSNLIFELHSELAYIATNNVYSTESETKSLAKC